MPAAQRQRRLAWARRGCFLVGVVVSPMGCQAFVDSDVAGGVGAPCSRDVDCHASECVEGACALECTTGADCPDGTMCSTSKLCQIGLSAAWIFAADPKAPNPWELSHDAARKSVVDRTPFLRRGEAFVATKDAPTQAQIIRALGEGYRIVFATSPEFEGEMTDAAGSYPAAHFVTAAGAHPGEVNRSVLSGRQYKSWYLAGIAAASKTRAAGRIGMIASYVTPTVVANTNAFLMGARRLDSAIELDVRWMRAYRTGPGASPAALAGELVAAGCEVVAHQSFDGLVVDAVEEAAGAWSIGHGAGACDGKDHCLGAVYWNWAVQYEDALSAIHRSRYSASGTQNPNIAVDPEKSAVNFQPTTSLLDAHTSLEIERMRNEFAREVGVGIVFTASEQPLEFTDGSTVAPGHALSQPELRDLCRFVVGVVENGEVGVVPNEGDCER